ncbi:amidase [Aquihabitans sp. G128]|uniref:amidase n=1 Tax=Aquihabitans sp. G128 TaxID=2849779 RepID=UPI001C21FF7D|nr:amidase [Aquihabitans sp. G128]QXC59435.1 amidase [Aquihabitans sp. G128]
MTDAPWQGDACSLVGAFRAGDRSPVEELDATYAAIEASDLNAFTHLDPERARAAAEHADLSLPFGGVPTAVKELEAVEGWPQTGASLVYKDRIADHTDTHIQWLFERGGVVPVGMTAASEFGGLNVSVTKLNGVTHNPWRHGRTAGGSSGGSASAVAGGLVSLATGGDGGGSIRIPAGYNGLLGMKGTFGRITRGPHAYMRPNTVVEGNLSRSVRDAARYYDVCAGVDAFDPSTLPSDGGWERALGTQDLQGKRIAIVPALGGVTLEPGVEERIRSEAAALIADTGMVQVEVDVQPPNLAAQWMMGNLATLVAELGDRWPRCADDLTDEVAIGVYLAQSLYNLHTAAEAEKLRMHANEAVARAFEEADFIVAATNPGPAFAAEAATSNADDDLIDWVKSSPLARYALRGLLFGTRTAATVAPRLPSALLSFASGKFPEMVNMGALTIISNIYGNPAVSIPAGTIDGLPVGMQVLGRHHEDALLFDVALAVERERPWPMVAPRLAVAPSAA